MNKLFPNVSVLRILNGFCVIKELNIYTFNDKKVNAFINKQCFNKMLNQYKFALVNEMTKANVIYEIDDTLEVEAYSIVLKDNEIKIHYKKPVGAFYATKTLEQVLTNNIQFNNLEIYDHPVIKTRGFMLDISRDKVPTIDTIKKIIDLMADLKMNHLELYVEGFSFEYQSFREFLEEEGYIKLSEYLELEKYANDRFIDFVPNQNGFGHMSKWLTTDKYKDLAVCPDGMLMWGRWRGPSTLDPEDERSIELIKKLYEDMLPHTKSKYFNMNFDEPFELGHGKSEGKDIEKLYLDYTIKVNEIIKKYEKIPLIWGDVLLKHKDSWDKLPKEMIFLDWGYDAKYPFRKHAKQLNEKNISFMTAPGTTSWCSFFGRYLDWYENIKNAIDAVREYNGAGVILTDWGDFGHLQFLPVSYAPLVYMGLYSWSTQEGCILDVREYMNRFIFKDRNNVVGDLLLDLSNYSRYDIEYGGNGTKSFYTFMWACCAVTDTKNGETDMISYFKNHIGNSFMPYPKFRIMRKFLNLKLEEMDFISFDGLSEAEVYELKLVKREIVQSIKILKMIHKVSIAYNDEVDLRKRINYLEEVVASKNDYLDEQKSLWLARNKYNGLKSSLSYIESFMEFASGTLNYLTRMGEQ